MERLFLYTGLMLSIIVATEAVNPTQFCPKVENAELYVFTLGSSCYHFIEKPSQPVTFDNAQHDCARRNGHLATISNNVTQQQLVEKVKDYDTHTILIGLRKQGSSWYWVTGDKVTFTAWQEGYERLQGDCVHMLQFEKGQWQPTNCNGEDWYPGYLCEHNDANVVAASSVSFAIASCLVTVLTSLALSWNRHAPYNICYEFAFV